MSTIILGVTGSIAAYKAVDVASSLVKLGHDVHCVCTPTALRFVTALSLMTLSRNPVISSFEEESQSWVPIHIDLATRADLFCILPATANTMACMAQGFAPNALTSLYLACDCPVLIFPAMNGKMWAHPATQQNADILCARKNHYVIGPDESGILACGDVGKGRLVSVDAALAYIQSFLEESVTTNS